MKKILLLFIVAIITMSSCKKDPIVVNSPVDNTRNFVQINTSVAGIVVDENDDPVPNAEISFGQKTALTDDNGIFKIDNATVTENRAYVKVSKSGYFHGSRTFFAYAGQRSHVKISLLEKTIQGTIDASGGNITLPEGVKLDFPNNAIANADGTLYTGTVQIAAKYLDPTANNISEIMPGDLRGMTTENVEEGLTTYGMVAVELLGSSGELLNVADGKTIQLTMPVASAQSSSAPSEIPLWYFDEAVGVWKEEGIATLQGDEYVGNVSHFTFWNCDINWDLVYIDGSVLLDGTPLEGAIVQLSFDNNGYTSYASDYTNEMGIYSGQVPANTTFTMNVHSQSSNCGTPLFTQEIGPFTDDATVPAVDIDGSTIANNTLTVSGMITDCNNDLITDGYVQIKIGSAEYYAYTSDGTIDASFLICDNTNDFEVTALDLTALKQSDAVTYTNSNNLDFGTLQACEQLDEFITYEYDGMTYTVTENVSIYDSLGNGSGYQFLQGYGANQTSGITIGTEGNTIGTFEVDYFWAILNTPLNVMGVYDLDITFTQFSPTVGEACQGTFTGTLEDPQTGTLLPLSGSFRAIREF